MQSYAVAIILLWGAFATAAWAAGVTDCSASSSNVLSLQAPFTEASGWYEGEEVIIEGRVQSIAGTHGERSFFVRGSDGDAEVLVVSAADVGMSVHEGQRVRVEGTLDMSTSSAVTMLLLPSSRAVEEVVLLCRQPVHLRELTFHFGWYLRSPSTVEFVSEGE